VWTVGSSWQRKNKSRNSGKKKLRKKTPPQRNTKYSPRMKRKRQATTGKKRKEKKVGSKLPTQPPHRFLMMLLHYRYASSCGLAIMAASK
jgi:hypothetical protein